MRKPWKTIARFALLGLATAALSYAHAASHDFTKPMNGLDFALMTASVILCPTQLIFAFCIDCEAIGWDGFIMYAIIGMLNMAIYAVVGGIVALLRARKGSPTAKVQPPGTIRENPQL